MECPWCGSKKVDAEFVDIGVGFQQVTPYECADCWARQLNPFQDYTNVSEYERRIGWHAGPRCWACLESPLGRWVALGCSWRGYYVVCEHPDDARNYRFPLLTSIPA